MQYRLFLIIFTMYISHTLVAKPITIMINPAGDAHYTGRKIDGFFERAITLQCFEKLKEDIESTYSEYDVHVISTRIAGDCIEELQNANFANRLHVDLFISLHFYQEKETKPNLFIYHFSYGNEFITKTYDLQFWPYDQAYLINRNTTESFVKQIKEHLTKKEYLPLFTLHGPYKLPFAPLIGIIAPAIGIEIGLKKKEDWCQYSKLLSECFASIITLLSSEPLDT